MTKWPNNKVIDKNTIRYIICITTYAKNEILPILFHIKSPPNLVGAYWLAKVIHTNNIPIMICLYFLNLTKQETPYIHVVNKTKQSI